MTPTPEPIKYYPLDEVVNSSNVTATFSYLVELADPADFIPIFNVICNNEKSPMFEAENYKDYKIIHEIISNKNFAKFFMILSMYKDKEIKQIVSCLLTAAIRTGVLSMTYNLCKYIEYPRIEYPHVANADSRKEITIALIADRDSSHQKIIDMLLNMKIIRLDLLMKPNSYNEFKKQRQRLIDCLSNKLRKQYYFHSRNSLILAHIVLFEMFYQSTLDTLERIIDNKCIIVEQASVLSRVPEPRSIRRLVSNFITYSDEMFNLYTSLISSEDADILDGITNLNQYELSKDFFPLYIAIERDNASLVKLLLRECNCNPNLVDYQNVSAFHLAAKNSNIFRLLEGSINNNKIKFEIKPDLLSRYQLYNAIKYDQYYVQDYCLKNQSHENVTFVTDQHQTFLYDEPDVCENSYTTMAIEHDSNDLFRSLIYEVSPRRMHFYRLQSLRLFDYCSRYLIAVDQGRTKMIDMLIKRTKDDINVPSHYGITPLTVATINCDQELMWKLLINGASIDVKIVNNIYFRHKDQLPYGKNNLVKTSEIFKTKSYYDDLFTFTYNFLTKKGKKPITEEHWDVLTILIQQMVLNGDKFEFETLVNIDEDSLRDFTLYASYCEIELDELGNELICSKSSMRVKDFLRQSVARIYNDCKEKSIEMKDLRDILSKVLIIIPTYEHLVARKFQCLRLDHFRTSFVSDLEYTE